MNKFVAELTPLVEFVELKMEEYRQASDYDRLGGSFVCEKTNHRPYLVWQS